MSQFVTSFLNVILLLTASIWLLLLYVVNAVTGHEGSVSVLLGNHFILDKMEE